MIVSCYPTIAVKKGREEREKKKDVKGEKGLYHTANHASIIIFIHHIGKESGDTFCKAADMQLKMNEKDEAANTFINASKSYRKSSPQGTQFFLVHEFRSPALVHSG